MPISKKPFPVSVSLPKIGFVVDAQGQCILLVLVFVFLSFPSLDKNRDIGLWLAAVCGVIAVCGAQRIIASIAPLCVLWVVVIMGILFLDDWRTAADNTSSLLYIELWYCSGLTLVTVLRICVGLWRHPIISEG